MKKFLTVLLVIAVMFTFSFGSAFAATEIPGTAVTTHDEAIAKATSELVAEMNKVAADAKAKLGTSYKDIFDGKYIKGIVDGSVYAATIDQFAADYAAAVAIAAQKVSAANAEVTTVSTLKDKIALESATYSYANTEYTVQLGYWKNTVAPTADALVTFVTTATDASKFQGYYSMLTWTNATPAFKAAMNAELAKIDMSLYTDDVIKPADAYKTTYAQKAAKAKADLVDVVADLEVSITDTVSAAYVAIWTAMDKVNAGIADVDSYTDIYGNVTYTAYKLVGIKTAEDLAGDKLVDDAAAATLIAQIKSNVATWTKNALTLYNDAMALATTAEQKAAAKAEYEARLEKYAAYEEVNTLLVEEGEITSVPGSESFAAALAAVEAYEDAEELAAILKIQVEKEGSAKYDAAKIDEILEDLQVRIYKGGAAATVADFAKALVSEDTFEWDKAHAICDVEDELEAKLYNATTGAAYYYAPEQAKVEAKYAAKIAKIEATATAKQLAAEVAKTVDISGIKTKEQVRTALAGHANTGKFVTAVNNYLGYLNYATANNQTYADAYRPLVSTSLTKDHAVVKYLATEGARTNADVAAYLAQAEAYAQTVKTNGEVKAAKAAANEAIKALPTVITLADKEAVKAAWELADDAGVTATKLTNAVAAVKAAEKKAIDDAVKALPAKLAAADDADVEAIYDAIDVYEAEEMYGYPTYDDTKVDTAAAAVRAAWLKDVHAAIAVVDAEVEATVEAAREAVDAYVERYTSVCADDKAVNDIQNMDKLTYAEAVVAAEKIEAVEALKITASSKATKGAITVKWTVKGDDSAVEGYEIWKSTKKNSGFKKAFTATKMSYKNTKGLEKGTRYYYKVRAIAYVGAEKITSDWSNKAYRVAK